MPRGLVLIAVVLMAMVIALVGGAVLVRQPHGDDSASPPTQATPPAGSWWVPGQGTDWQWQLSGPVDTSVDAAVFDIDGADNTAATVAELHAQGAQVICYFDAGGWENHRSDADRFPESVKGSTVDGWPDERWLDIRQLDILLPIMEDRITECREKGFDAVEPDLMDAFSNNTGFPLTHDDQIAYNRALAELAHEHGLGVALKNDPEQAAELEPHFDFAIVEECVRNDECDQYLPFSSAGKAVLHVEYEGTLDSVCPVTASYNFSTMLKELDLGPWRRVCP